MFVVIKTWVIVLCNSKDLIGLAVVVYLPGEIETIKSSSDCSSKPKLARS